MNWSDVQKRLGTLYQERPTADVHYDIIWKEPPQGYLLCQRCMASHLFALEPAPENTMAWLDHHAKCIRRIDPMHEKVSYNWKAIAEKHRKEEREAIVKWLRRLVQTPCDECKGEGYVDYAQMGEGLCQNCHGLYTDIANDIEKGDHKQ